MPLWLVCGAPAAREGEPDRKLERLMMAERVASLLGNPKPEEVVFAGRNVSAKGQSLSWKQACAALPAGR